MEKLCSHQTPLLKHSTYWLCPPLLVCLWVWCVSEEEERGQGICWQPLLTGARFATPFTDIVWHCCTRHAPFMAPLLSPFSKCPVVLLCLSARMSRQEEECFPDGGWGGQSGPLDICGAGSQPWHVKAGGPFEGLAAVCLDICSSDHEISCQVICCEIHYEKHPETDAWLEILSWLNCRNYLPKLLSSPYVHVIYLHTCRYKIMFAVMPHTKRSRSKSASETSIPDYCTPRSAVISENTSLESSQQSKVDELLKCNRKSTPHGLVKQWM